MKHSLVKFGAEIVKEYMEHDTDVTVHSPRFHGWLTVKGPTDEHAWGLNATKSKLTVLT